MNVVYSGGPADILSGRLRDLNLCLVGNNGPSSMSRNFATFERLHAGA